MTSRTAPGVRYEPGPVSPPQSPHIEAVASTIECYASPDSSGLALPATDPLHADVPGPSTTYIPQQPSPPLPDLRHHSFLPDDDSDESDDEIIAQLPIYLSPSLYPSLHLFQYPLHDQSLSVSTWAESRGKYLTARVKEAVGRVEVEIPVDAGTNVWRDDRARDLGFVGDVNAVNGVADVEGGFRPEGRGLDKEKDRDKEKKKKKVKEEKWGDKMRLRSEVVPNATGYYSGIMHDGEWAELFELG